VAIATYLHSRQPQPEGGASRPRVHRRPSPSPPTRARRRALQPGRVRGVCGSCSCSNSLSWTHPPASWVDPQGSGSNVGSLLDHVWLTAPSGAVGLI